MYFDLNVHVPPSGSGLNRHQPSKKGKAKQTVVSNDTTVTYSSSQLAKIELQIDLLVHLGYTVIGLNQTVKGRIDQKTHINALDPLLGQLKRRQGILILKRLTIILDDQNEKNSGITTANSALFAGYDILAVCPTTLDSFSQACLTYTLPSNITTHIISLPLTSPRFPFRLKHSIVNTAIKNGGVFELNYAGALQSEDSRRNWWASARELSRATKGKGLIVSSGAESNIDFRAPNDVANLMTFLGLALDVARHGSTATAKSVVLRAQSRKTYRTILSEPKIIMPVEMRPGSNNDQTSTYPLAANINKAPANDSANSRKRDLSCLEEANPSSEASTGIDCEEPHQPTPSISKERRDKKRRNNKLE